MQANVYGWLQEGKLTLHCRTQPSKRQPYWKTGLEGQASLAALRDERRYPVWGRPRLTACEAALLVLYQWKAASLGPYARVP